MGKDNLISTVPARVDTVRTNPLGNHIEAAQQSLDDARERLRKTRQVMAVSLDAHSAKLQEAFCKGLDLMDPHNQSSVQRLETAREQAAQRQQMVNEGLMYAISEMTSRQIAAAMVVSTQHDGDQSRPEKKEE